MARRRVRDVSLRVDSLEPAGLGVGQFEGRTVKVRNGLPGERVQARVLKRYRGEWFGEVQAVEDAAADRVDPPCAAYPRCGGCSMQHMAYDSQLALKQQGLLDELAANDVTTQTVRTPVASARLHYRRKARLGVRCLGDEVLLGFRESFSSRVARLSDCKTLVHPVARLLPRLRATLQGLEAKASIPQVEVVAGDRAAAFVVRHLEPLSSADRARLAEFSRRHGVAVYLQPRGYDEIALLEPAGTLDYALPEFGVALQFEVADFIQANAALNVMLVSAAVIALAPEPEEKVWDLFCGIGNFSLPLARRGARVTGVETAASAIGRAQANALRNGLAGRCEFHAGDLYDPEYRVPGDAHLLLLDPPRTGAGPNLVNWLRAPSLRRTVYVSCNPVTFAQDARVFLEQGFVLKEVGIFDMFPQTGHVETLGVFTRGEGG